MNLNNWMKDIDDNVSLTHLTIPGTHDSGTEKIPAGYSHTQNFDIYSQLVQGIRFLDIRLVNRGSELQLWHGLDTNVPIVKWFFDCEVNFDTVLGWCKNFLNSNSSETILMSVKNENDGEDITPNLITHFNKFDAYFYKGTGIPAIKDARKKIVLLKRFKNQEKISFGVNWTAWQDNQTFSFETAGMKFVIEDVYTGEGHNTNTKVDIVNANLTNAADPNNRNDFYLSFVSISANYAATHTPYQYAWGGGGVEIFGYSIGKVDPAMNPSLKDFLTNAQSKYGRYGVVVLDFYNNQKKAPDNTVTQLLINSNFIPLKQDKMYVKSGNAVDYIEMRFDGYWEGAGSKWSGGEALFSIKNDPIVKITGRYNVPYAGKQIITQLRFYLKSGKQYGSYGGLTDGVEFSIGESGYQINGLFGSFAHGGRRSEKGEPDRFMTQIGAYLVKTDNSSIKKTSPAFGVKTETDFCFNPN
jgi:1-phosphatidylinositol phosphodiesterase